MNVNDPAFLIGLAAVISAVSGAIALFYSKRKAEPVAAVVIPARVDSVNQTFAWSNIVIASLQDQIKNLRADKLIDDEDHRRCMAANEGMRTELTRMYRKHGNGG